LRYATADDIDIDSNLQSYLPSFKSDVAKFIG
jgi:hypothetical protein